LKNLQLAAPTGISLFVPVAHYNVSITTSKKYLINCHVLLKHFELGFSIYSATTGKNVMQITHHLSEL